MKKVDLSSDQVDQRKTFIEELLRGGWVVDDSWNNLFDGGADLEPEAQAEFSSECFQVRIGLYAQNAYLMFECESRVGSGGFGLYLFFANNFGPVLQEVVARVKTLSRENYLEMVRSFTLLCDEVLLNSGGELVKVSPVSPAANEDQGD